MRATEREPSSSDEAEGFWSVWAPRELRVRGQSQLHRWPTPWPWGKRPFFTCRDRRNTLPAPPQQDGREAEPLKQLPRALQGLRSHLEPEAAGPLHLPLLPSSWCWHSIVSWNCTGSHCSPSSSPGFPFLLLSSLEALSTRLRLDWTLKNPFLKPLVSLVKAELPCTSLVHEFHFWEGSGCFCGRSVPPGSGRAPVACHTPRNSGLGERVPCPGYQPATFS